ncbi:MAG: hypothetical protein ACRD27_10480, partial [Terracidiphilus sp.]
MSTDPAPFMPALESAVCDKKGKKALWVVGWFSMGMAVAAVGIFLGAELRNRYRFSHRTPYDFYSSAGEQAASEFGMG